jgi:hypothetical protein
MLYSYLDNSVCYEFVICKEIGIIIGVLIDSMEENNLYKILNALTLLVFSTNISSHFALE